MLVPATIGSLHESNVSYNAIEGIHRSKMQLYEKWWDLFQSPYGTILVHFISQNEQMISRIAYKFHAVFQKFRKLWQEKGQIREMKVMNDDRHVIFNLIMMFWAWDKPFTILWQRP